MTFVPFLIQKEREREKKGEKREREKREWERMCFWNFFPYCCELEHQPHQGTVIHTLHQPGIRKKERGEKVEKNGNQRVIDRKREWK